MLGTVGPSFRQAEEEVEPWNERKYSIWLRREREQGRTQTMMYRPGSAKRNLWAASRPLNPRWIAELRTAVETKLREP